MEDFVQKNCNSTYCNILNSKLPLGYFSANITKFSEQLSLHPQQLILSLNVSEHTLS